MWLFYILILIFIVLDILGKTVKQENVFINGIIAEKHYPYLKYAMSLFMIILLCLTAFRGSIIGNDTVTYITYFNAISILGPWKEYGLEFGYVLINYISGLIYPRAQLFFIISAVFYYLVFIKFITEYSNSITLSVIIFFTMYFSPFLNILRQAIAVAFIVLSFVSLVKNKNVKFIIFTIIAFSLHNSAILLLCLYVFKKVNFSIKKATIIIAVVVVLTITNGFYHIVNIIMPEYAGYFSRGVSGRLAIPIYLLLSVIFFIIINNSTNHKIELNTPTLLLNAISISKTEEYNLINWLAFTPIVLYILGFTLSIITRFSLYFEFFYVILLPNAITSIKSKDVKITLLVCIVFCLFAIFTFSIYYRPDWNYIFPYVPFWNE